MLQRCSDLEIRNQVCWYVTIKTLIRVVTLIVNNIAVSVKKKKKKKSKFYIYFFFIFSYFLPLLYLLYSFISTLLCCCFNSDRSTVRTSSTTPFFFFFFFSGSGIYSSDFILVLLISCTSRCRKANRLIDRYTNCSQQKYLTYSKNENFHQLLFLFKDDHQE